MRKGHGGWQSRAEICFLFQWPNYWFLMLRNCHGSPCRLPQLSAMWALHDSYTIWPVSPNKKKQWERKNPPTHNKTTIMLLLNCSDDIQKPELRLLHPNGLFGEGQWMANVVHKQDCKRRHQMTNIPSSTQKIFHGTKQELNVEMLQTWTRGFHCWTVYFNICRKCTKPKILNLLIFIWIFKSTAPVLCSDLRFCS